MDLWELKRNIWRRVSLQSTRLFQKRDQYRVLLAKGRATHASNWSPSIKMILTLDFNIHLAYIYIIITNILSIQMDSHWTRVRQTRQESCSLGHRLGLKESCAVNSDALWRPVQSPSLEWLSNEGRGILKATRIHIRKWSSPDHGHHRGLGRPEETWSWMKINFHASWYLLLRDLDLLHLQRRIRSYRYFPALGGLWLSRDCKQHCSGKPHARASQLRHTDHPKSPKDDISGARFFENS